MFRTLLTPLRAHFDSLSPRPSPNLDASAFPNDSPELDPEDFARDVLVELMRNAVERLKTAEDTRSKLEMLTEIQSIMSDGNMGTRSGTKDVFREMDGFLALVSTLSTAHMAAESPIQEPEEQVQREMLGAIQLTFVILAETMHDHEENASYFKLKVGYDTLSKAIRSLALNESALDQTLGFLLSFAMNDFAASGFFVSLREIELESVESTVVLFTNHFGLLRNPEAIRVLWDLLAESPTADPRFWHATYRLVERLCTRNHRNHVALSGLGLAGSIFDQFCVAKDAGTLSDRDRSAMQKLLRRLLETGVTNTAEARRIFQRAVREDDTLDADVLEIVRPAIKAKWPAHFSLENHAAMVLREDGVKGLPVGGFTFMAWLLLEKFPTKGTCTLFGIRFSSGWIFHLSLRPDGVLEIRSSGNRGAFAFANAPPPKSRWFHLTLVHHPHRVTNPTIRLFIDGALSAGVNWAYPKPFPAAHTASYVVGDDENSTEISWCIASAHLLAVPLVDDLPRLVHHLGPRYTGNFQAAHLVKFLTYEASTSLNVHLFGLAAQHGHQPRALSPLMKAIRDGPGIAELSVVFSLTPASFDDSADARRPLWDMPNGVEEDERKIVGFKRKGDVFVAGAYCLDLALWKLGGAAIPLRLVELANTTHELSRSLGILADSLRNSWQNSEDMERLRGYDILGHTLKSKAHLINMTGFETIFECLLGLNFRAPDQSTITNTIAYRAIALDFELWVRTRKDIQHAHLDHFTILLHVSRFKKFNTKQRIAKMGLVRKFLFVLQTNWYSPDTIPLVVQALKVTAQNHLSMDDTIKPIVSYLAANLHDDISQVASPRSVISLIDHSHKQEKAEQVLDAFVDIAAMPGSYAKLAAALPLARVLLLLLSDHPSPFVAGSVLRLLAICLNAASSFSRKFELVSGWSVLKMVLPKTWDPTVHEAVFDVLLGRGATNRQEKGTPAVACPQICPAILSSLRRGLENVAVLMDGSGTPRSIDGMTEAMVEALIETLIELHSSVPTFRQLFRSHQTTQIFVDSYQFIVTSVGSSLRVKPSVIRLLEKLTHLALSLALDPDVSGTHKREILDHLQKAETIVDSGASHPTAIDPSLVGDSRPVHRRLLSARLSLQVSERTVVKSATRVQEWRKSIMNTERKRLRKTILDLRENNRQLSAMSEWKLPLSTERGLWCRCDQNRLWRLDETEGPFRVRKKLESQDEEALVQRSNEVMNERFVEHEDPEVRSVLHMELPPWAEGYDLSAIEAEEDRQLTEDVADDKHRRVRHELEPHDVIEAVSPVARISGVDSSPGLLIFGRTHLYMLDGLTENDNGEVVDVSEAPKKLFFVPGSIIELNGPQRAQRWPYEQIANFSDRTFLFRDVALEMYFKDSRSLLVVFVSKHQRESINQRLQNKQAGSNLLAPSTPGLLKTPVFGKFGARVLSGLRQDGLGTAQRKWQAREISNFTYLSILNQISGRTPSDATQYPIFPWVLRDYVSDSLDLASLDTFRDFNSPMGAQNEDRREAAHARYTSLEGVEEVPFHYGTHFSSSMIVCHFLIRMEPFTHMFKTLQGGDWDLPDRLFSDVQRAWESASKDSRGDVRELIPEFFTCPEFLENSSNLDFGIQQNTGERIHHVKLPPWAKQDPLLFITLNRKALESDYVSEHLPAWIDLIWGWKQKDPDSFNVFHPLSYEGAIDLDAITNEMEREATVGIIHNFGQTPRKLFQTPHPERYMHGLSTLPIGNLHGVEEDYRLLTRSPRPVRDVGPANPIRDFVLDLVGERVIYCPEGSVCVPNAPDEQVLWGPTRLGKNGGGELRVVVDRKVVEVIESAAATCAAFADTDNLVTGSSDYTVRIWRVTRSSQPSGPSVSLSLSHIMRGHTGEVLCVAASRPWSLAVSGSVDGTAIIWDLNKGVYVRSITHGTGEGAAISLVSINDSTGYIATCSRAKLCLHSINARPMAALDLTASSPMQHAITSLSFLEREYSHLGVLATGSVDGTITLRTWNTDETPPGERAQWRFVTLRVLTARDEEDGRGRPPTIVALKFVGETLYHSEDTGKVFTWEVPE